MFSEHFSFEHDIDNFQDLRQEKSTVVLKTVRILQLLLQFLAMQPSRATIVSGLPLKHNEPSFTFYNLVLLFMCVVYGNCREITVCLFNDKVPLSC